MANSTSITYRLKRKILTFTNKISRRLSKPDRKFAADMVYGILASKSCLLTDISDQLHETVQKANTRLRSKYYKMIRHEKKKNVAVAAVARELACFIWGMMTGNISIYSTAGTSNPAVSQG